MMKGLKMATLALAFAGPGVAWAQVNADVACEPVDGQQRFVYDCEIMLSEQGKPLEGATIQVGADMPSMPMAHNIAPVTASALDEPGRYAARLKLDMAGEWALRLDVSGPVRDRVVEVLNFE
ncbi:MAG: FixH family protein [Burkholderiaceae bacterium]